MTNQYTENDLLDLLARAMNCANNNGGYFEDDQEIEKARKYLEQRRQRISTLEQENEQAHVQVSQMAHLLNGGTLTEEEVINSGLGVGILIEQRHVAAKIEQERDGLKAKLEAWKEMERSFCRTEIDAAYAHIATLSAILEKSRDHIMSWYIDWAKYSNGSPDYDPAYKPEYPEIVANITKALSGASSYHQSTLTAMRQALEWALDRLQAIGDNVKHGVTSEQIARHRKALSLPTCGDSDKDGVAVGACPVCNGQGTVSRPPWVAGDIEQWTLVDSGSFKCRACVGSGLIRDTTRGDKERLDWLEANWRMFLQFVGQLNGFESLRAAIDSAKKGQSDE